MLVELAVRDLGILADVRLELGPGMTALTGETGAGKTLLVGALELLLGGRGDQVRVRPGAEAALVEGRFEVGDDQLILSRAMPASGRGRAWIDTRMAPMSALAEEGSALVDLHGQHGLHSLLGQAEQRDLLDAFGGVDTSGVESARMAVREAESELASMGGDTSARAREMDMLRFQIGELDGAGLVEHLEEGRLEEEEDRLAGASSNREAVVEALHVLAEGDSAVVESVGTAVGALAGRRAVGALEERLRVAMGELADIGRELRISLDSMEEDPERLAQVQGRLRLLRELRRKYGATLAEVMEYHEEAKRRLESLESHEERVEELEAERAAATEALRAAEQRVGTRRRRTAPALASAIEGNLRALAMPRARLQVETGGTPAGDQVRFLLAANPGEPPLPLSKVASGGELARTVLAARLVARSGPPTLVFDEVDAGIGGEAALAVGRALASVARARQVLVVTHLAQVAAYADRHIGVRKLVSGGRTVAEVEVLDGRARAVELSRMLSGQPSSAAARLHAEELLEMAAGERDRSPTRNPRHPSATV